MIRASATFAELAAALGEDASSPALEALALASPVGGQPHTYRRLQAHLVDAAREGMTALREAGDYPRVVVILSRARCGSTALMRLFGAAGIPVACQPLKNALRHKLVDQRYVQRFPLAEVLGIKCTFGPFVVAECLFDPVGALLEAGLPAERLHLVFLDRDPLLSLLSWRSQWRARMRAEVMVEHFILSTLNMHRLERQAGQLGLGRSHYVYEQNRHGGSAIERLFQSLGIPERYDERVLTRWAPRGSLSSNILTDPEPAWFHSPGLHNEADYLLFSERPRTHIPAWALAKLDAHGVTAIYERIRERAESPAAHPVSSMLRPHHGVCPPLPCPDPGAGPALRRP